MGQTSDEVRRAAKSRYRETVTFENCSPDIQTRQRQFKPNELCLLTKSSFGMSPIFWIFHFDAGKLSWVRVYTQMGMEF